jgi:FixJ family two-component response regulator
VVGVDRDVVETDMVGPSHLQSAFVIDDDIAFCDAVTATLAEHGIKARSFHTAKTALAALDGSHPGVIVLDIALLQSDAVDVLRGLGERGYAGPVQLVTGGRQSLLDAVQRIGQRHGAKLGTPLRKPLSREAIACIVASMRAAGS